MSDPGHPRTDQRGPLLAHTGQQERLGPDALSDLPVTKFRSRRVFHGAAADFHVYREGSNRTDAAGQQSRRKR